MTPDEKTTLDHALKLLARRPQTEWELRSKLQRWGYRKKLHTAHIDTIISTLYESNYLDDTAFTRWFIQDRQEFKPMSVRRLKLELRKKGVPSAIISQEIVRYDEDLALRTVVLKKSHMKREKLVSYLQRQGFRWDMIEQLLSETDTQF